MTDFFEYIDDYKSNLLSAEAKSAFETEMGKNEKLKHAVENFDLIKKISKSLIEDETREKINELKNKTNYSNPSNNSNKEKEESKVGSIKPFKKWLGIAAAFLCIIVSIFLLKNNLSSASNEEILVLEERPISSGVRGENDGKSTLLDSGIDSFDLNKFDKAKLIFENDFQSDSLNQIATRYLAHIYFYKNDYSKAKNNFEALINHASYGVNAKYHLVLCYILLKDKPKAQKYFDEIKNKKEISEEKRKKLEQFLK